MGNYKIVWSEDAEMDLDAIYEHYLAFAPDHAKHRVLQIMIAAEELVFAEQWQVDEFDEQSRRIIVEKKFRVVYRILGNVILITRVYPTKKLRSLGL
jgi:plasmid stabilization system protein ParE